MRIAEEYRAIIISFERLSGFERIILKYSSLDED